VVLYVLAHAFRGRSGRPAHLSAQISMRDQSRSEGGFGTLLPTSVARITDGSADACSMGRDKRQFIPYITLGRFWYRDSNVNNGCREMICHRRSRHLQRERQGNLAECLLQVPIVIGAMNFPTVTTLTARIRHELRRRSLVNRIQEFRTRP
jgi:hypothetical protein